MNEEISPRIAFVGSGVMAEAMIGGMVARGVVDPGRIWAAGPRQERGELLSRTHGVRVTTDNLLAVEQADIVVLAVRPKILVTVLGQLRGRLRPDQLVMSILAGARMAQIAAALDHPAVVRCIPNLPCRIHRGMTVWAATPEVTPGARESVRRILETMGKEVYVPDELDVERAGAVSGIGPAVAALFVKALEDGANFIGQSRELARQSVLQTILGTAEMILASPGHIAELIDDVASPGGSTSRALQALQHGRFPAVVTDAMDAAYRRGLELGAELDEQVRGSALAGAQSSRSRNVSVPTTAGSSENS